MMTGVWQAKVAEAIASAIQNYFSKRTAAHPYSRND
jgi:N-acetylmuramoyl-L-alanine amidase